MSDPAPTSRVQQFLALVASKTEDSAHQRILKAAQNDPSEAAVEAEFLKLIEEILHED